MPKRGEPGSETWQGTGIDHPGGATWMTGTYDTGTGHSLLAGRQPGQRSEWRRPPGDNLYTDSVVALDPTTGKLKWYFQFTPHDVHDYDAMAPPALVDTKWQGKPRKLMVQANRNGFLLCSGPNQRQVFVRTALYHQADLGHRADPGRAAHRRSGPRPDP